MNIRKAEINDLPDLKQLFYDTVTYVCQKDYDQEQINIWRSSINNETRWQDFLDRQFLIVAQENHTITGFASLDKDYIDMLFVHKDHQNKGIAKKLYLRLENEARLQQQKKLTANVSKTAKVFFEGQGFDDTKEQEVILNGIKFINYRMSKVLVY